MFKVCMFCYRTISWCYWNSKSIIYNSYNLVLSDQAAANREIKTLKKKNNHQTLGKLLYEYLLADV